MATPIILNVVNDAQESADMTTAQLIVSSGHNYYAASLFDEAKKMKIDNLADVYNEIEMTNKPTAGQLYVNNNDQVAMAVIINNKCYKKNFIGDIEIVGTSECDLGFVGQDEVAPTISQEVINTSANSNDWYKEDLYIKVNVTDNESGVAGYKRCMGSSECNPDSTIYNISNQIYINTESDSNYVCVIGVDNYGNESDKECIIYKLDKTSPTITGIDKLIVNKGDIIDLSNGVNAIDNLSSIDGNITINPNSVDNNTIGITNVTYQVKDKAGNETIETREVEVLGDSPSISFSSTGIFNENNWAKEDFYVSASVTDNSNKGIKSIKWCSTTSESCSPTTETENVNVLINNESASNKVCVEAIDNNDKVTTICSNNYQLDKTQPIIEGIGDITVQKDAVVNLSENVVYNDSLSGINGELSITPSTVDTSVTGTKQVTYKVQDMAGNVRKVVRNIIVDAEAPTITFNLVDSSAINSNGWAKNNFYIRATITDNSGSGINSASSCTTNSSSECEPIASFEGTTKDFYIESEGSNRACISVTDNNNKTTKVCSNTYNLDKTNPTAGIATFTGTLGSNSWYTSNVTVNVLDGSDSLSGHDSTTSNVSSINSNTAETIVTVTTTDLAGNTESRDYLIKLDKDSPNLVAKDGVVEITEGDSNDVSNYFNISYSISGGSMSCTPTNTNGLTAGTQTLRCTAIGGNGLTTTATKQITVKSAIYEDGSGANVPELATNMIPITYNGSNWIYADVTQEWYDYDNKEWANAVVLNSGVSKSVGQTISESEIALWYVWIPRYKYQLFNANNGSIAVQLINIEFESGTATTGTVSCTDIDFTTNPTSEISETCTNATNGNWYTHPAFTFGDEEVTGFWVGKFEVSGSTSAITIKPGVQSLRSTTVSAFFTAIQNMSTIYSLSGDSHMMKNMEWGAVAYLKQSVYGLGMTDIAKNGTKYYTGGGTSSISYKSNTGQSTTGTVYGVYDMSGGAYEYVMGNMVNNNGEFGVGSSGFSNAPDSKYYDKYSFDTSIYTSHSRGKLGDATKETLLTFGNAYGGWYGDNSMLPYASYNWFVRGSYYSGDYQGIFSFGRILSLSDDSDTTRAILIP